MIGGNNRISFCLPSHEGSGLKSHMRFYPRNIGGLPSHEGSGLKFTDTWKLDVPQRLPSHEGSGLKYIAIMRDTLERQSPLA